MGPPLELRISPRLFPTPRKSKWIPASGSPRRARRARFRRGGSRSERARLIAEKLVKAGLRCPVTARLGHEIWVKLLGNVAFNPISALTRATLVEMVRHPDVCALVRNIMIEVEAVANQLGIELPVSIDQRIAGAEKVGQHKTSMLQISKPGVRWNSRPSWAR